MDSEGLKILSSDHFFPSADSEQRREKDDSVGLCFPSPREINIIKPPPDVAKILDDAICFFWAGKEKLVKVAHLSDEEYTFTRLEADRESRTETASTPVSETAALYMSGTSSPE